MARRSAALVHHWLVARRGGERTLESLCGLLPGAPVFTLVHDPRGWTPPPDAGPVRTSPLQAWPGSARWFRGALPFHPALYRRLDLTGHDLVVSSDAALAKTVRVPDGAFHLCYCYSPPRYAWDLRETYLRLAVAAPLRPVARAVLARAARADSRGAARVDRFVAISREVAERIRRCYGRDADVIHPPVDTAFFTPGDGDDDGARPYLLLGAAVAYKRFEDAVDACRALDRPLVVAGGGRRLASLARRAGRRTRFVRDPDDATVRALYRGCRALLYPGEEDFGLVPVEAMACGRPVIAWRRGGAAETVAAGTTGWLYERPGPQALAAAIEAFERAEASIDPAACVARAARYDAAVFRARMGELLSGL